MINLTIDGHNITVPKGTTVYHAAKQLNIEIPIFCYLDRMPPFGACRMCLVEVEKMNKPQTSCTLEATEGMVVKTQSTMAEESRKRILELLLINHPLDCPICDRGGECPLQDNTIKYGPGMSQFFEKKRHFKKAYSLGPVLMLDRERCITCARCTRFSDIVAGDHALEFIDRGYKTEVGTPDGLPAESKFIGNTIFICPVGALTSNVYRFRARPWDNKTIESTCTLCPVGCSMYLDQRDGEIMRTRSRENRAVNDIWMCDKGWFGYEFTDHENRLQTPLVRRPDGKYDEVDWDTALDLIAKKFNEAKSNGKLAGLGGNPLTTEENFLFQLIFREGAQVNHVDHRVGSPIFTPDEEGILPGMNMSIGDCEDLSFAVLLGTDLTEEFPVIWLRLKQAINKGAEVIYYGHYAPETGKYFAKTTIHAPGKELEAIAGLPQGKKGAIFVGRQYLESPNRKAILAKLLELRQYDVTINILEGRGNSIGARLAGMRPDLGPLGSSIAKPGLNALQVIEEAAANDWGYLHVAGADPAVKYPAELWKAAREKIGFLVVQDLFLTETARQADVILPTLCYAEKEGRFVNIEGRVQAIWPGKHGAEGVYSDAEIFERLGRKLGLDLKLDKSFAEALKQEKFALKQPEKLEGSKVQSMAEGKLRASFAHYLFDHGVRMQHDPHLIQLAKEPRIRINPADGTKHGLKNDDRAAIIVKGHSVTGKVHLDKRVAEGTVVLPLGFPEMPVHNLAPSLLNGMEIELTKVNL